MSRNRFNNTSLELRYWGSGPGVAESAFARFLSGNSLILLFFHLKEKNYCGSGLYMAYYTKGRDFRAFPLNSLFFERNCIRFFIILPAANLDFFAASTNLAEVKSNLIPREKSIFEEKKSLLSPT